ncbi:MAG: homoserine O-acetyltransferase [Bacteroidota bacterium]
MLINATINRPVLCYHHRTPLALDSGQQLPAFSIAYETYGRLSAERNNAILVCHALTKDARMAGRATADGKPGWWDTLTGPGKALDTDRYFLICSNVIGGCGGSTGPTSINPATGRAYALDFPVLTVRDMVRAQQQLVEHLGIEQLHGIAGGCFGGMQALEWLIQFPGKVRRAAVISTTEATSAHTIALFHIMRRFIREDPDWCGGRYYEGAFPSKGLTQAILMGIPIWMNRSGLEAKFGRRGNGQIPGYTLGAEFTIEDFLEQTARRVDRQFDPNSLLYLTRAQEYFDLVGSYGSLEAAFGPIDAEVLLLSYDSDWRYPSEEMEKLNKVLRGLGKVSRHEVLHSPLGHGAFMYDVEGCGVALRQFFDWGAESSP